MPKKKQEVSPSLFTFMCLRVGGNYHKDFSTKEEALEYIESLNDPKIEWYGIYEIEPGVQHMKLVVSKRLISNNVNNKQCKENKQTSSEQKRTRRRQIKNGE